MPKFLIGDKVKRTDSRMEYEGRFYGIIGEIRTVKKYTSIDFFEVEEHPGQWGEMFFKNILSWKELLEHKE